MKGADKFSTYIKRKLITERTLSEQFILADLSILDFPKV